MATNLDKLLGVVQSTSQQQTHLEVFHFYGDRVQCSNASVWYDAPSDFKLDCNVRAAEFTKAVNAMDAATISVTLSKTSAQLDDGTYSVRVPLVIDEFPLRAAPEVDADYLFAADISPIIEKARVFMGNDNWKLFTCNLYFSKKVCYASSSSMLACFDASKCFEREFDFALTQSAVDAILRHAAPVLSVQPLESGVYVIFEDGAWIYARNNEGERPPFDQLLTGADFSKAAKFEGTFAKAVADITAFSMMSERNNNEILFTEKGVETAEGEYHAVAKLGRSFKQARFDGKLISLIAKHATRIDLNEYPSRVPFCNDDQTFYGVVMGMSA